jgi:hypothetical protein
MLRCKPLFLRHSRFLHGFGMALALSIAGLAIGADIRGTKHNLASAGHGSSKQAVEAEQVCIFCHTPFGSDAKAATPLWNKSLPGTTSFAIFNTTPTFSATTSSGKSLTVGSVSLACLSCHDGAQAMDNVINAPGSGAYNLAGTVPSGWVWNGSATMMPGAITQIAADLKSDHPVGVLYCGGGLSASGSQGVTGSCVNKDFISPARSTTSDGRSAALLSATLNGGSVFWIDLPDNNGAPPDGRRGKQDLALYTRDVGTGAGELTVECSSCHDPHVEAKNQDGVNFMRVSTAGSKICMSCHVK